MPTRKKKMERSSKRKDVLELINLKVKKKDRRELNKKAAAHVKGNLSEWLRFAGLHFKPTKKQLAELEA